MYMYLNKADSKMHILGINFTNVQIHVLVSQCNVGVPLLSKTFTVQKWHIRTHSIMHTGACFYNSYAYKIHVLLSHSQFIMSSSLTHV